MTAHPEPDQENVVAVLHHARDHYPWPVAPLVGELVHELDAATPNHQRIFLLQIDLFEATVAYLSFVLLAALSESPNPLAASRGAVEQLRSNPKLCTGHWWALLRETARDVQALGADGPAAAAGVVSGLLVDAGRRSSALSRMLDAVPGLRNRVKGHAWTLPPEQYEALARNLLVTTSQFLDALRPLTATTVLHVQECRAAPGGGFVCDVQVLESDRRRPDRRRLRHSHAIAPRSVIVVTRTDVAARPDADIRLLDLTPFAQVRAAADGPETLYLLQALDREAAHLAAAVGGHSVDCRETAVAAARRLDELLGRGDVRSQAWRTLHSRARTHAATTLASPRARAAYEAERYLVRGHVTDFVARRAASGARLAVVTAPSGMGKTALLCHLLDRWTVSEDEKTVVVLLFASELDGAEATSLTRALEMALGEPVESVEAVAEQAHAEVHVLVDGLDRSSRREALVAEIRQLSGRPETPLRILATSSEPALAESMADALRWALPPLEREDVLALFSLLGGSAAPDASATPPPDAVLDVLRSPLLVRLAHGVNRGRDGETLTPGRLFLAYSERYVFADAVKGELALRLAEAVLETGDRSVPVQVLAQDTWLRAAVLSTGPGTPLGDLMREHVVVVERTSPTGTLPLPSQARLGFAVDSFLEFLAFVALARRHGTDGPQFAAALADAAPVGPVVGALRFLFVESLLTRDGPAPAVRARSTAEKLAALRSPLRRAVLARVLLSGVPCEEGSPFRSACALLSAESADGAEDLFVAAEEAVSVAREQSRADALVAAATLAVECGGDRWPERIVRLLLRRAHVEAAHRHADIGRATAEDAVARARRLGDPSLLVESLDTLARILSWGGARRLARAARKELVDVGSAAAALSPAAEVVVRLARIGGLHGFPSSAILLEFDAALEVAARSGSADSRLRVLSERCRWLRKPPRHRSAEARPASRALLTAASSMPDPALEAHACHSALGPFDPAERLEIVARGLRAAAAAREPFARALLVAARASALVQQGEFASAERDAAEAVSLLEALGHRTRRLDVLQDLTAVCAWELGRPGRALAIWRELQVEFAALEQFLSAALGALLVAQVMAELGLADAARLHLAESRRLAGMAPGHAGLRFDLAEGQILRLEGHIDRAATTLQGARKWGIHRHFADFVFQPGIHLARLWMDHAAPGAPAAADAASPVAVLLQDLVESPDVAPEHRARYDGEISALYARWHLERGAVREGRVWSERATAWFAGRATHRSFPEAKAVEALVHWTEAARADAGVNPRERQRAEGLRTKARQHAERVVLPAVETLASSFADADEAAAYRDHHPAITLLRRHGILEGGRTRDQEAG